MFQRVPCLLGRSNIENKIRVQLQYPLLLSFHLVDLHNIERHIFEGCHLNFNLKSKSIDAIMK
jgi:hypothetical protein